jgi:hypothetical protein
MKHRLFSEMVKVLAVIAVVSFVQSSAVGQQAPEAGRVDIIPTKPITPPKWTPASRTPDGQPDISGTWSNFDPTTMEKGEVSVFGDRPQYTDINGPVTPKRPSMVVEPATGILPVRPEALKRAAYDKAHMTDSWVFNSPWERCITRGNPGIMLPSAYSNGYEILQTPGYVTIFHEMIHETIVIPLDGRPHVGKDIRLWMGDSRGRWEGNTLVVDTTNFTSKGWLATTGAAGRLRGVPTTEQTHLVERYTRVSPLILNYEVTITDPSQFTAPFKIGMPLNWDPHYRMLEYTCTEGNDIHITLRQGREKDKAAATAPGK